VLFEGEPNILPLSDVSVFGVVHVMFPVMFYPRGAYGGEYTKCVGTLSTPLYEKKYHTYAYI
jgi:hypothetical protein